MYNDHHIRAKKYSEYKCITFIVNVQTFLNIIIDTVMTIRKSSIEWVPPLFSSTAFAASSRLPSVRSMLLHGLKLKLIWFREMFSKKQQKLWFWSKFDLFTIDIVLSTSDNLCFVELSSFESASKTDSRRKTTFRRWVKHSDSNCRYFCL